MARGHGDLPATRARERTILALSILSGALFLPIGLHLPYFPVYLSARGLTDAEIAVVIATPMILRIVATPIVATIADTRGIAETLAACALAMLFGYCGLGLSEGFAAIFCFSLVAATALGLLPSLSDALTLSQIRRADLAGTRPVAYARIRVWTPIGVLAVMLLSGPIVEACPGDRIVLALAAMALIPTLAALLAVAIIDAEQVPVRHDKVPLVDPTRRRRIMIVIAAAALVQSSHAQVYSFGTLHWKAAGYSAEFIGIAWAVGVGAETLLFLVTARFPGFERAAPVFLVLGGLGAALRWLAMSTDPGPESLVALQAMHGLSFAATYFGSVLVVASLAGPGHRARTQGGLAAASALGLALATFVCGRLVDAIGETTYVVMALLAGTGLCLALFGAALAASAAAAHSAAGRCSEP